MVLIDKIIRGDLDALHSKVSSEGLTGSKALVTGGAGFLGSWICDFLIESNVLVDCVDDLSTGMPQNIDQLTGHRNFTFQKTDVTNLPSDSDYQLILHLASHASPDEYHRHPIETLTVNSHGTKNLLELARRKDAVFFYSSTAEVYGNPTQIPTPESYWGNVSSTGPRSCYDEGKRFAEALCMAYYRTYGLDVRIIRIFNTYGPRLRSDGFYGRVLSRFIEQALSGRDITVHGKGEQTRSFTYVTDTIHAVLLALKEPRMKGEVVNVGNPHEVTILDLAKRVKASTHSNSNITFHPRPPHDPQRRSPIITRANEILGWTPNVSLDEGLEKTVNWFKIHLVK